MIKRLITVLVGVLMMGIVAQAQEQEQGLASDYEVVVDGLNHPRGFAFTEDGTVYVANVGIGGETEVVGPRGPALIGATGALEVISPDGEMTTLVPDLPSTDFGFGERSGPQVLLLTDDMIWLGVGESVANYSPFASSLIGFDRETMLPMHVIPLFDHEVANNPDGLEMLNANPVDLAVDDAGTLWIVDSGCNCVMTWTAAAGLEVFVVWDDNPVPTAMDFGPDGDLYVSFLSPFPFVPGSARIDRYDMDGALVESYDNMTTVVDVWVDAEGTIHAVEFVDSFGETGWAPNSGRVVTVGDDGVETLMDGLNFPYRLAMDHEDRMVVSINAAFMEPGTGQIIVVE